MRNQYFSTDPHAVSLSGTWSFVELRRIHIWLSRFCAPTKSRPRHSTAQPQTHCNTALVDPYDFLQRQYGVWRHFRSRVLAIWMPFDPKMSAVCHMSMKSTVFGAVPIIRRALQLLNRLDASFRRQSWKSVSMLVCIHPQFFRARCQESPSLAGNWP